jgi:hypothetical protein
MVVVGGLVNDFFAKTEKALRRPADGIEEANISPSDSASNPP